MELKRLEEFVTLAETGNYLEAADALFLFQSTLSKHIMALEKELGVHLFERTTRKVRLSSDGECLLPYAVKITQLGREAANLYQHQNYCLTEEGPVCAGVNHHQAGDAACACRREQRRYEARGSAVGRGDRQH